MDVDENPKPKEDPEIGRTVLRLLEKGLKDQNSLTQADKEYLRARASYIKQKHQDRLPAVFGEQVKVEEKEQKRRGRPPVKKEEIQDNPFTPPDEDDGEDETEG